mmetsp:Transcript_23111/g.70793  ORF Transcript_23111/g.70793 Transcript_23111/m.70793 type:complete len:298 (-) Transcript_23111:830-1723(-)|eukprot:scaffold146125_cov30-Tisochrysis_lutea.AAC.1
MSFSRAASSESFCARAPTELGIVYGSEPNGTVSICAASSCASSNTNSSSCHSTRLSLAPGGGHSLIALVLCEAASSEGFVFIGFPLNAGPGKGLRMSTPSRGSMSSTNIKPPPGFTRSASLRRPKLSVASSLGIESRRESRRVASPRCSPKSPFTNSRARGGTRDCTPTIVGAHRRGKSSAEGSPGSPADALSVASSSRLASCTMRVELRRCTLRRGAKVDQFNQRLHVSSSDAHDAITTNACPDAPADIPGSTKALERTSSEIRPSHSATTTGSSSHQPNVIGGAVPLERRRVGSR